MIIVLYIFTYFKIYRIYFSFSTFLYIYFNIRGIHSLIFTTLTFKMFCINLMFLLML